ncbi:MAG: outer membrane beta-barrel protein [Burkholderiales bacterium]
MRAVRLLGMLCLACLGGTALAQAPGLAPGKENGWYLGSGLRLDWPRLEDTDVGYRDFGGYRFTRHWGVEMGYSDFGRGGGAAEPGSFALQRSPHQSAWTVAGTGVLPIGWGFSLQGRLGLSMATPEATQSYANAVPGSAFPRYRPYLLWGVGGQYDLTGQIGLRVDYNSFGSLIEDPGGTRTDLWSINAIVRF